MSGSKCKRSLQGPDTQYALVPNLATFCIMTKPFHTAGTFFEGFEKGGGDGGSTDETDPESGEL